MDKRQMDEWIAGEMRRHPWADERIARKIVEDNLRDDIHFYDHALNKDQRMADEVGGPSEDEMRDPYPSDDEEDDEDDEDDHRPRRRRGPGEWADRAGKPSGDGVLIVFGGKKKHSDDPYPED